MATLEQFYAPRSDFPPKGSEFESMKKQRVVRTAFGEVPLSWRFWFRRSWIKYWILLVAVCVLVVLMTVYHHQIIQGLRPFAQDVHDLPAGWLIPIGILFVISFPPLFGHEIVALLCGLIWGLWEGFGIVAAGTLLGEIGNFYALRYLFANKARKLEAKDINFACMTRLVEEGGFWVVFLARLSAIPGHLTTAVFATTRMGFWTFLLAAVLTTPKQLMIVYLGTIFNEEDQGTQTTASKVVQDVLLVFSFLVTLGAAFYLYTRMAKVRPQILAERKLRGQEQGDTGEVVRLDKFGNYLEPFPYKHDDTSHESLSPLVDNGSMPAGYLAQHTGRSTDFLPNGAIAYNAHQAPLAQSLDRIPPRRPPRPDAVPDIVVRAPTDSAAVEVVRPSPVYDISPPLYRSASPRAPSPRAAELHLSYGQAL